MPHTLDPVEPVPLADLRPHPGNYRTHPPEQIAHLAASLSAHGVYRNVVAARDGTLLAGHGVVEAARSLGIDAIPVRRLDLDPSDPRALAILAGDNTVARLAADDDAALAALLDGIRAEDRARLLGTGYEEAAVDELLARLAADAGPTPGLTDPDDVPEPPAEPVTKPGDLWQLGRHRLLCGDSNRATDRARLLGGTRPDLANLDPPYGIGIVAPKGRAAAGQVGGSTPFGSVSNANRQTPTGFDRGRLGVTNGVKTKPSAVEDRAPGTALGSVQRGPRSKNQIIQANLYPVMAGDDEPFDPAAFLDAAPVVILWGANYYATRLPESSCWLCWDKREGITRNSFADCELAWCSHAGPARVFHHLWNGLHKGSQHGERRTHPTEKPVALYQEIGALYAPRGVWLDLFAGSGAQVIAAERTRATCLACEIEPLYCDVAVRRWEAFTGQTAVLAERVPTEGSP